MFINYNHVVTLTNFKAGQLRSHMQKAFRKTSENRQMDRILNL